MRHISSWRSVLPAGIRGRTASLPGRRQWLNYGPLLWFAGISLAPWAAASAELVSLFAQSQKSSPTYCPGDGPPPPPAPCPTISQGRVECVAPVIKKPAWSASSTYWTSYPDCNGTQGSCASEGEAWTAWQNHITGSICQSPVRTYVCTDLYGGYQLGHDVHSANVYSLTVGTGTTSNCNVWTDTAVGAFQQSPATCPVGYDPVSSNDGPCYTVKKEACPFKNPIQCAGGQKVQTEMDIADSPEGLGFARYYSSAGFYTSPLATRPNEVLGINWRHSWQSMVIVEPSQGSGQPPYAFVIMPSGDYRHFSLNSGSWTGRLDKPDTLQEIVSGGIRTGWMFTAADDAIYRYDANGVWLSVERHGLVTTLTYSDSSTSPSIAPKPGLLIRVTDARGRSLDLRYDTSAYLTQVIDANGASYGFRYLMQSQPSGVSHNSGQLKFVDRPGGTTREYRYDESAHVASSQYFNLLSGIIDENGDRYGTYKFNAQGRAYQEYHGSGSADFAALDYTYFYDQNPGSTITTDALGQYERRRFSIVAGIMRDAGRDRCTTASCGTITNSTQISYSSDGNRNLVTDFKGTVTDHDYNSRGLEVKRVDASNISGTGTPKRTIETQWHTTLNRPVLRQTKDAAGAIEQVTAWTYNSRGQITARCELDPADSAAMAYTCSETTAPSLSAKVRRWTYAYCEAADVAASGSTCPILGLTKSVNGPRDTSDAGMSSLDDVTTFTYYATTDESGCGTLAGPCQRKGDLWKTTNALSQVSEVLTYDKNGRAVLAKDANGVLTGLTYNARGWVTARRVYANATPTTSAGDAVTTFAYDGTGQITLVTQPDGVALGYVYDDAHRLTDIVDSLGNRIHYTLDNAGNRTKEETFDATYSPSVPGQGLKRSLARQYNALSRLVKELNAGAAATRDSTPYDTSPLSDGYDANGNSVQWKDGLNVQTQQTYDPLNRLVKTIQDYTGTDAETGNATTEYGYDARDNLRTVKDPDNLTTTYTYDGLGNLSDLDSPDTGHTDYSYDRAGNRISQTDNRGVTSSYTYDALGRLSGITYPTNALNVTFAYDQGNATTGCTSSSPLGRLTRMTDATGSTTYCYDKRGNVATKKQITAGSTLTVAYTHTLADRIATITYPSGGIATYSFDSAGRTSSLSWKSNALATPVTVVSGISYYPFGPPHVLTYGNGRTLTKTYDQDYAIDSVQSSALDGLVLDFGRDVMGNLTSASSALGTTPPEREYVYDKLYRLTRVNDSTGAMLEDYNYNKTGDRTLKQFAGQAAQVYTYLSGTHRLGSVAGTNRSYDANGNTTDRGDGVTLTYDDRNRLVSAAVPSDAGTYDYSGRGERTYKAQANSGNTLTDRYIYNESGQMLAERNEQQVGGTPGGTLTEYLFIDAVPVAISRSSVLSYVEADHLGAPRVAANPATNAKEWGWDLLGKAFGENAATTAVLGKDVGLRYPGQWVDGETGLSYNYFRNYETYTGRYIESDPVGLDGGITTYSYVASRPLEIADATGLDFWVEGGVATQGGGTAHRKLCVGKPDGGAFCMSFGCTGGGLFECLSGPGEYYEDKVRGGDIEPDTYRTTTPATDARIIADLSEDLGKRRRYWLIGSNCRDFSYVKWQDLNTQYPNFPGKPSRSTSSY